MNTLTSESPHLLFWKPGLRTTSCGTMIVTQLVMLYNTPSVVNWSPIKVTHFYRTLDSQTQLGCTITDVLM